jgi:hypothetical protein
MRPGSLRRGLPRARREDRSTTKTFIVDEINNVNINLKCKKYFL